MENETLIVDGTPYQAQHIRVMRDSLARLSKPVGPAEKTVAIMAQLGFDHLPSSNQYQLNGFPGALCIGGDCSVEEAHKYALDMHLKRQRCEFRENIAKALRCEEA